MATASSIPSVPADSIGAPHPGYVTTGDGGDGDREPVPSVPSTLVDGDSVVKAGDGKEAVESVPATAVPKEVTHIVMFTFEEEAKQEEIDEIVTTFCRLPHLCRHPTTNKPYIHHPVSHGINISKEGLSEGLTHVFVMKFPGGTADRDYYVEKDPVHLSFVKSMEGKLKRAVVVDFEQA